MRERGKKKEGQRNVIPPQIFNGQEFRGVRCGHCYLLWPASTFFQGLRRLWYRQWRWCPWRVPRPGKVKTKGTTIRIIKRGGFNLCKETLYTCQQWKSWALQIAPVKTGAVAPEVNKLKVGKLDIKEEAKSSKEKDEVFDETFVFLLCISSYLSLLFFHLFSFRYIVFSSISLFLMKNGQAESRKR